MFDDANMSDTTLLVSVEDLINMAMGPSDKNVVNFKLIQTVLHILARQMRILEQRVQIQITDRKEHKKEPSKRKMDDIKEERKSRSTEKPSKEKAAQKEIERIEKSALKEKEKAERAASKDREKADRAVSKEREKAEKAAAKEKEKAERAESKDREKAERASSKERDKAEKEREKTEKAAAKEKDKAERASSKEREKAERASSKERDKADRASSKEREKADKASEKEREKAEKEREKAEKAAVKDKDKAERASSKEREKAEKEAAKGDKAALKEKEKAEKAAAKEIEKEKKASGKEKEKADKEKERADKDKGKSEKAKAKEQEKKEKEIIAQENKLSQSKKGRAVSDTSIVISEVERRKEKVLVVEKGPTTRTDARRESIEVVTKSQFDIVLAMVKELQEQAAPAPPPALPENKKLMDDLVKGSASLTDTMQAMQVKARVVAAEKAITRMGEMLTALAAAGALPEQFNVEDLKFEPIDYEALALEQQAAAKQKLGRKSVAIDPMAKSSEFDVKSRGSASTTGRPSVATATSRMSMAGRPSVVSKISMASVPAVTHPEMDAAIRGLRDDLTKTVQSMTTKATSVAENANSSAKAVAEKLEIALQLDLKISTLHSLVCDYAEQLSGFDAGLTTQMSSFRDQMNQMKAELGAGLKQLEQVNNNAETAAVMELTERYEGLVVELDHTMHTHRALTAFQNQLGDELHSLVECVEMLREQKADRDEVLDGLRDKADNTRLAGLLTVAEFDLARQELEKRLDVCHDKFKRQENVWMTALKDLTVVTETKAEITQLLAAREAAELMLMELLDKQMKLAVILGEPKAAMLTRALARGAMCGSCLVPALMEPLDKSYGAPPPLPAMRPHPIGAAADDQPCVPEWKPPEPPDNRDHICHRWCGGSHTLLSEAVTRERAAPAQLQDTPTKRYAGYGLDGRLYMLEEELQPCVECNKFSQPAEEAAPAPPADGAGDQGPPPDTT